MNWCQPHWQQLRQMLASKGLDKFGAKNKDEAVALMRRQMENAGTEDQVEDFDPLLGSWSRVNAYMAESLTQKGRGQEIFHLRCPLCILVEDGQPELVENWLEGVTDHAKLYAIKKGWMQTS